MPATAPRSKELRELLRRLKTNYRLEEAGSGHYRILDPKGEPVTLNGGKQLTIASTPHGGRAIKNVEAELERAQLLKGTPERRVKERDEERTERMRKTVAERAISRQKIASQLRDRLDSALEPMGGLELRGMQADLAYVATMIAREQGRPAVTPDLTQPSISRVHHGGWVEPQYQELWNEIAERLEQADDPIDTWFALVRRARGITEDAVEVKRPVEGEWPFRVELLSIEALLVDHDYQRPVPWAFVRKIATIYDESLVGTIDVSERRRGAIYAILDGQLRYEASKMVGKTTMWASIYSGLDRASEARFFLHKNRDRKAVHPYYTWKARIVALDPEALEIARIVEKAGYRIWMTSAGVAGGPTQENNISAIAGIQQVYKQGVLVDVLGTLRASTHGRSKGQDANLIRGLGYFFFTYSDEVDRAHLVKVIAEHDVEWFLGRAREGARSGQSVQHYMARVLVEEYNRGLREGRLNRSRLFQ